MKWDLGEMWSTGPRLQERQVFEKGYDEQDIGYNFNGNKQDTKMARVIYRFGSFATLFA